MDNYFYFQRINSLLANFSNEEIENILLKYFTDEQTEFTQELKRINFPREITFLIDYFESLIPSEVSSKNGIVFTPKYISDFIVKNTITSLGRVIDPSCGCGIFLVSAFEYLVNRLNISPKIALSNLYGSDINTDNIRRCKIVLNILAYDYNVDFDFSKNILCLDSLRSNLSESFGVEDFNYIVGNPPYVNPHDLDKDISIFLKEKFLTNKVGTSNIFYAFIEHSLKFMHRDGYLSFIVPNNFLTISAGKCLRKFISDFCLLEEIIDFSSNMIFNPVRTYSCIIKLSNKDKDTFKSTKIYKTDDIRRSLERLSFVTLNKKILNADKWLLSDFSVSDNIALIEKQPIKLGKYIRTGIATLKDNVYIIDKDINGFFKEINGVRYKIDEDLVKPLYKIPDINKYEDIKSAQKYIIFPYQFNESQGKYSLIPENVLKTKFANTYVYLSSCFSELCKRDKGKPNPVAWYAYGRTQGLNKYGKKILFPTFSNFPKFRVINDENALFCNGYAIFESEDINLDVLSKVINSKIMAYYVSNTSYPIEGGYYCYQKKYIENFSIPVFSDEEKKNILQYDEESLNNFLVSKYHLNI
ncbi:MAG: class I SAM-dependent DNA methyltransferase [Succinivibrio sp.]